MRALLTAAIAVLVIVTALGVIVKQLQAEDISAAAYFCNVPGTALLSLAALTSLRFLALGAAVIWQVLSVIWMVVGGAVTVLYDH